MLNFREIDTIHRNLTSFLYLSSDELKVNKFGGPAGGADLRRLPLPADPPADAAVVPAVAAVSPTVVVLAVRRRYRDQEQHQHLPLWIHVVHHTVLSSNFGAIF